MHRGSTTSAQPQWTAVVPPRANRLAAPPQDGGRALHCQISRGAPAGQDEEARGQSRPRRTARPKHDSNARSHQASVRPDPAIARLDPASAAEQGTARYDQAAARSQARSGCRRAHPGQIWRPNPTDRYGRRCWLATVPVTVVSGGVATARVQ
jgi:hypothetical protein